MSLVVLLSLMPLLGDPPAARESIELVDYVAEEESADRESVDVVDFEGNNDRVALFRRFKRIFRGDAKPMVSDDEAEYEIRLLKNPLGMVNVALGPVREANKLLPEALDPFKEEVPTEETLIPEEVDEREAMEQRKRKMLLAVDADNVKRNLQSRLDSKWHYQAQAGGSFRQGNNSSASINSQLRAEKHTLDYDFLLRFGAFYNQLQGGTTNRRLFAQGNFDKNLRGRWIAYVREDIEYDTARLIDLRYVLSYGLGFRFVDRLNERLIGRLGPTASYVAYAAEAENDDEARSGWLFEFDYRRIILETARFDLTSTAFPDFDSEQQFRIRTESALLFPIGRSSVWNWKVGLRHEYIMNPVITTNPNDVEGYFSIVYTK